ncbi:MAG: 4-hydroxy-tetrahydrodipicolinate reductase [Deltaproteobacteria bacterium]
MIKIAVAGVGGRMGERIISLLLQEDGVLISGALEREGHPLIGRFIAEGKIPVSGSIDAAAADADGIIDFTTPAASLINAEFAARTGRAMVIGTTGFREDELARLKSLAEGFACVLSPNTSVGVNVMFEAARSIALLLADGFDVEIAETHHRHKIDSPSGTALKLGEVIAEALSTNLKDAAVYSRHGRIGERGSGEIGIQALRGGDVVGEHTVFFFGRGERIELTHRASTRDNFASGAIRAMKWVVGKPAGIYTMKDVLGI